jgi:hypothetical protein
MKSFKNFLAESQLKNYIEVSTKNPNADFWIVRRGSSETVGKPVKEYNPEHFGVTVTRKDRLVPDYLYYALLNIHTQGYFKPLARGTLKLVNIRKEDILSIPIG